MSQQEQTQPPTAPASAAAAALKVAKACLAVQDLDSAALANVLGKKGASKPELELLYGETPLTSVISALEAVNESLEPDSKLKFDGSETFVDLGAGRGHVLLAAAAVKKWKKCVGIELVQEHVTEFEKAKAKLKELEGSKEAGEFATSSEKLEMICADVVENPVVIPTLEATNLLYSFDMAFPPILRRRVSYILSEFMRTGALVVSTHLDRLPSADFVRVGSMFSIQMEWGAAPAQLYQKGPGAFENWLAVHGNQLKAHEVPQELWASACVKLIEQSIDIGAFIQLAQIDGTQEFVITAHREMKAFSHVFVLDHCWSFASMEDAKASLQSVPGLRERLMALRPVQGETEQDEFDAVLESVKSLLASYTMVVDPSKPNEQSSVFYVLDEVGSRIRRGTSEVVAGLHDGPANFRIIPIYSFDHRMAFSLGYPIRDISSGSFVWADHEQGWDASTDDVLSAIKPQSDGVVLPEMKEFAAKANLDKLIAKSSNAAADAPSEGQGEN